MISLTDLGIKPGSLIGIGSLPMTDPDEAIGFVLEHSPAIPFWPQLPNRTDGEGIIRQFMAPIEDLLKPGRVPGSWVLQVAHPNTIAKRMNSCEEELSAEGAAGFFAFMEALEAGRFDGAQALKGQIAGPITLSFFIELEGKNLANDARMSAALSSYLARSASWQVRRLALARKPVILFVDEPGLQAAGETVLKPEMKPLVDGLSRILQSIRNAGGIAGIHCCGTMPLEILELVKPDVFSFNAQEGLETFLADQYARAYLNSGGVVAYGMVPPDPGFDSPTAEAIFDQFTKAAGSLGDEAALARLAASSLVSPTCGHGTVDLQTAKRSFKIAKEISALMGAAAA